MTKDKAIKFLIVLICIFVIISLVGLTFHVNNKTDNLTASYNARKEDLQVRQAQLENSIVLLNITLNQEKSIQENLANDLAKLKNDTTSKTSTSSKSSSGSGSSAPKPAPAPTPAPVTRAS
jgi:predicted PurR-regulated permease PerM